MWSIRNDKQSGIVVLVHSDKAATPSTDYQQADAIARKALGCAMLYAKGYSLDLPMRAYYTN